MLSTPFYYKDTDGVQATLAPASIATSIKESGAAHLRKMRKRKEYSQQSKMQPVMATVRDESVQPFVHG